MQSLFDQTVKVRTMYTVPAISNILQVFGVHTLAPELMVNERRESHKNGSSFDCIEACVPLWLPNHANRGVRFNFLFTASISALRSTVSSVHPVLKRIQLLD